MNGLAKINNWYTSIEINEYPKQILQNGSKEDKLELLESLENQDVELNYEYNVNNEGKLELSDEPEENNLAKQMPVSEKEITIK